MLRAVIMAGGSGTRFWPMSRQKLPKQFLTFFGDRSLLQLTVDRVRDLVGDRVLILTNALHVERTRHQLPEIPADHIIGEPHARDTAPCVALAAAVLAIGDPNSRMLVLAADHLIQPAEAFHRVARAADRFLRDHPEALLTFGIPPTYPATAYGYLERGQPVSQVDGITIHKLHSFQEKPSAERAKDFCARGNYLWNAGIFCWKTAAILDEIERHAPDIAAAAQRIAKAWHSPNRDRVFAQVFEPIRKISIDFAVMEKSPNVYMIEAPFQWDDVGNWNALERVMGADAAGNVVRGSHVGIDSAGCIVVGEPGHCLATLGLRDVVIVHTKDATLVADRRDEQGLKRLLAEMEKRGLSDFL